MILLIKSEGSELMIKKIAWEAFKNTGDINAFLEFKEIENIEKDIKQIQEITNMSLQEQTDLKNKNGYNN